MTSKTSLRLKHPTLDLRAIANALNFPIARIWASGTNRRTPQGDLLEGVYEESYVALRIIGLEPSISGAIAAIDAAFRKAICMQPILGDKELEKSLYCTILSKGEVLDTMSLALLVELDIRLEIAD